MAQPNDSNGLSAEAELQLIRTIAVSAYRAYCYAARNSMPWDQLPEEAQNGWLRAVFVVHAMTEDAHDLAWSDVAKAAYGVYAKALGSTIPWSAKSPVEQTAWQAAVRHILTVFEAAMADEPLTEDTLQDMEVKWLSWAERKAQNR